jgi:Tfp pilus assembly protein PilX
VEKRIPMRNNKGSAITLVLIILGVVGLIGVGLMSLSRINTQFTAAILNYDQMFNLADGANAMAYKDLKTRDREDQSNFVGASSRIDNVYQETMTMGNYYASLILEGYSTESSPGWETGSRGYYHVYWVGEGKGKRLRSQLLIEAATQKTKPKY